MRNIELAQNEIRIRSELELQRASRTVGYTVRTDWLGTTMQQAFVEVLTAESKSGSTKGEYLREPASTSRKPSP